MVLKYVSSKLPSPDYSTNNHKNAISLHQKCTKKLLEKEKKMEKFTPERSKFMQN